MISPTKVIAKNVRDLLAANNKTDRFTQPQPSEGGHAFVYEAASGKRYFIRVSEAP